MLLTIGMIVKNEEKYLRMCLEALQPILKNISSELIIVDTGSTDKTVEIAKEFTDKVFFFEWINDFAAARNFGLEKAQGEWFMAVDADEVFTSCDDIIYFFKSGEYKDFNSASYTVRNYSNPERKGRYNDCNLPRLTKLLPTTRYENAVHERLNTYAQPIRLLEAVADHYGYVNTLRDEKAERNYKLLKERIDSGEESASLYREIFESRIVIESAQEEAYDYLRKGIEYCKKNDDKYIIGIYHSAMVAYYAKNQYDKAMEIYDEYFAFKKTMNDEIRSTDLEIIAFAGMTLYSENKYAEAYQMMKRYFDLYDHIKRNKTYTVDMLYTNRYMSDERAHAEMNIYYAACCLETEHFKEAENSFRSYPVSAYSDNHEYYFMRIRQEKNFISKCDTEKLASLLSKSDSKFQSELFRAFRSAVFSLDANDARAVISKLEKAGLKSAEQRKLLSIYEGYFSEQGASDALLMDYVEKYGMDHPDLFLIMHDECMNVIQYLSKCEDIEKLLETGIRTIDGFGEKMKRVNFENVSRSDIYTSIKACLCTISEYLNAGFSANLFYDVVGKLGIKYLEAFGERSIPSEVMAAVIMAEINICRSGRNFKGCIDALRRLIQMNKKYAPIAMDYQNLIKADMERMK